MEEDYTMMVKFIEILKAFLSATVVILYLYLSRYQRNEHAKRYTGNANQLGIIWSLKSISVIMLFGMMMKIMNPYIAFYILTPVLIALNLLLFYKTDWMWGFMTFFKGFYCFGLIIILTVKFLLEEVAILELVFTLLLAIFESITALSDGYKKIQGARQAASVT